MKEPSRNGHHRGADPGNQYRSCGLCAFPRGVPRRLIDVCGLGQAAKAGLSERYRRGESPHTIQVWWARRPHRAMRALVFACLCRDTSAEATRLMNDLSASLDVDRKTIEAARAKTCADTKHPPRLLDMFGGGGTIPCEGTLLGADVHSIDSNELSVFIQKSLLVYPHKADRADLSRLVETTGRRVLDHLARETEPLFPLRRQVTAYLWTYSLACASCGYRFYLTKRPWASKKKNKRIALKVRNGQASQSIALGDVPADFVPRSPWTGRNGKVRCPNCEHVHDNISVQLARDELVGLIGSASPRGKTFSDATASAMPKTSLIAEMEARALEQLKATLPRSTLPQWSGIVNPALYGIRTHADFLNPRQRVVLLYLIKGLCDEYDRLGKSESQQTARAVVALLSGLIDQVIDWNCRLSMWIPQNEQIGRAFCGPGVSMLWDYAETDPLQHGPANLWGKLERILTGTRMIARIDRPCSVRKAHAQKLPYPNEYFDAIVTDPPYYDNIYYSTLADFFYAWKRWLMARIDPGCRGGEQTDAGCELVASAMRSGSPANAHDDYCRQLGKAIAEADRVLKPNGTFAMVYSHGSLQGWEAIVRAYRPTRLRITGVQPLQIERRQRPRAIRSDAVNTCVVFVAHKSPSRKKSLSLATLADRLRTIVESPVNHSTTDRCREPDAAIAAFAQGVAMLANVTGVRGSSDDLKTLELLATIVRQRFEGFKVSARGSL